MIPPPACQERASLLNCAYVYLLRSVKTGRFYLGWTTDLNRRFQEHNLGKSSYTRSRGPWELINYELYQSVQSAKNRERALKHNPIMMNLFKKRALVSFQEPAFRRVKQVVG
ncbi:MAG: GIY-YIG nuclease family protein [Candidatus Omnitrophica bacterium]|nr:GIY-YIG nuclease family protein [Candidatus Omnitrophota bacterium]